MAQGAKVKLQLFYPKEQDREELAGTLMTQTQEIRKQGLKSCPLPPLAMKLNVGGEPQAGPP